MNLTKLKNGKASNAQIWLDYPYKKYPSNSNTIPLPYFPKTEITDTEYSLEKHEWHEIMDTYFDIVEDYLIQGNLFVIPKGLGSLKIYKTPNKRTSDIPAYRNKLKSIEETKERVFHNAYSPFLKWDRRLYRNDGTFSNLLNSKWRYKNWKMTLASGTRRKLFEHLAKAQHNILAYPDKKVYLLQ
jgi:nucleoid DNA-binding protein